MKDFEKKEIIYENAIAGRYNRDYHQSVIMRRFDDEFANFAAQHYKKGDRVLDLGCGAASLWGLWKERLPEPARLIGVDLSKGMVEECRKAHPEDDFRIGSVFKIPLESGSVDLLIASSVLHHVPDKHLPEALAEISRVLDEHGTLVGREPLSSHRLADEAGWFSGAIMAFRHMVFRLTHTREYPEPAIGEHHHAYDPSEFIAAISKTFAPKGISLMFPFSGYVGRCDDALVAKISAVLDGEVGNLKGHILHYAAAKNYNDAADVKRFVEYDLNENTRPLKNKAEFMALLDKAAEILERELGKGTEKIGR